MNARKSFHIVLLAILVSGAPGHATTVGLRSDSVNSIYAEQRQSQWCWAACIQMIAKLYGADLTQDEVVARSYGPGVNRPGSPEVITANLNASGTTHSGRRYTIRSTMLGNQMLPAALVAELTSGHPVLLGCDTGGSGHAVVCTAVTYQGPAGNPLVTALTVRDPWPCDENRSNTGRRVVSGADLGPRIMEGWVVHVIVHNTDGQAVSAPQGYTFNDPDAFPAVAANTERNPRPQARSDDGEDDAVEVPRRAVLDAENLLDRLMSLISSR